MGYVRIVVDFQGKNYEVEFPVQEVRQITGIWHSEDWQNVANNAMLSMLGAVQTGGE